MATKAKAAPAVVFTGKVGKASVIVARVFRRRYVIAVNGKVAGYITARDPMNAAGRVATIENIKELKLHAA